MAVEEPPAPQGVVLIGPDGVHPVSVAYAGRDQHGFAIFEVVDPVPPNFRWTSVHLETLPARTLVRFPMRMVGDEDD